MILTENDDEIQTIRWFSMILFSWNYLYSIRW